jgi:hypothetical protein
MGDLIDRAKAALENATPGPWAVEYKRGCTNLKTPSGVTMCDETYYPWVPDNDADWHLIALAPDLARALIAAQELEAVANRAIRLSQQHEDFRLYAMEPLWQALAAFRAAVEGKG